MTALVGFWARAQAWLRHAISALPADARAHAARARFADAGLLGEAPHPASLSLRAAFDASLWVGITARSAHGRVPLALTIPRARGADDLASRTWNARFTFVRTKPLRDVARTNHLAPGGVLADYRATRRVGSAALFSPTHFGERKGLEGLIPQGLWFAAIVGPIASARVVRRGPSVALPGMSLLHRLRRETACLLQRRFVVYRRRGSSWALFADCG